MKLYSKKQVYCTDMCNVAACQVQMSIVALGFSDILRKSLFKVHNQVRQKPGCMVTEVG